ncbi:NlpC/P60 family protein [Stackebrandtia albiflava]|nr:C40 family peptidase [Stackebrandtia albiflava]
MTATVMAVALGASPVRADPVDETEAEIEAQFHELEGIIEDYNKVREDLEDTNAQIAELEAELEPYEEELAALGERVGSYAANVYMNGKMSNSAALLTSGTPDQLVDRLTMMNTVVVSENAAIQELKDAAADLFEQKAVLDALYTDQSAQEEELVAKKTTIEDELDRLQDVREEAYRDHRGSADGWVPPYVPGDRGKVVRFALEQVGETYVWAASGPDGWDCSGLTMGAWAQVGVSLPHNAAAQWNQLQPIARDQLQPGDLVFFNDLTHVALYIGDGRVVQAAVNYYNVAIETIESAAGSYYGAARIPGW